MENRFGLCGALALILLAPLLHGAAPVAPPAALVEDSVRFSRCGQGTLRWKSVLKVYDVALHFGPGVNAAQIFEDIPTRLQLGYHRGLTAVDIIKGGDELLRRNLDAATLTALGGRLAQLNRAYVDVKEGDSYTLTYVPSVGTTLRLNGKSLVTIPGHDFASAYFRIWLGKDPISGALRDQLLGR